MRQKKQKNRIYEKIIRILPLLLLLLIIVIPFLIAVSLISFDGSFFEGFESGSFSTYGWEASAGTGAWAIATTNPYGGTYHAQAGNTASVERTLSLNISTLRYQNISFKFYYQTANTETGDYIAADWYNGTAWVNVLNVSSQPTYTLFSINLPSQADNNSNFKIRFRCMTNATNERCRVDNVSVTATTLINTKPTQAQPILNSTYNTNLSSENITCYNQSTYDADNDEVKNIFSWRKNNIPFAIVIMPFEGGKDSLNNNDFSGYSNSGKINNALFNKTGGYDGKGAYQFDGSSAFIELVDSPSLNVTENITILAWVKTTTTSPSWQFIIEKGINDSDNYAFALQRNQLFFEYANSNYYFFNTTTANINANVWYFVGVSTNRTNLKFYLNGNEIQSYNLTEPIKPWTGNLWIGRQNKGTSNFYFNGTIDEVMIFDKTLSPQQINAIYKNKSNVIVSEELRIGDKWSCAATPTDIFSVGNTNFSNNLTIRENINPSVKNITPPKNSSYKNGSVINITANVTDNYKLDKVFVNVSWNNGSWVSEMTNISEIYNATFTNTSAEGVYNITIIANDSFGNINNTEKSYFIIYTPETNPPLITLNYPPNNFITNNNYINFNWTTIDDTSEIMMCNITINNAVNISGITAYNNTPVNYSIKNLTDNTYYWNISCSDNLNNSNTSETRTFLIDTAAPYWADASLNQSDVYWNQTIYFNASWLDNNNLAGYIFYINQTGNWENSGYIPFSGQQNISEISFHIDAIAGANVYWYFWANDTAGNFNQTEIKNFSVKPRPTAVTILLNQSIYPQGLEPGLGYDILIPINVTFKDTISNNFISDGDCAVSNDKSSEIIYLNFNSTSKSYEGKIDTSWLYDNVTFNASCSAGINYLNSSNITSANVWAYIYLWDWYNLSYYGGYDKYWLRKNPPEGGLAVLTEEKNLSPGLNGIRTFYFYGPNINGTMARDFEIYNLHTISLNISLNDTRCKPIICSSIINKALESLIEGCGNEHTIPANTPTVIEDNITGNYTVRIDEYIGLKLYLNCSDYVNMSLSVYFNYSGMQPNIFASEAVPMKVSSRVINTTQLESGYFIGPNSVADVSSKTWILFNNSDIIERFQNYYHLSQIKLGNPYSIKPNSTYVYNSTGHLWASDNVSAGAPRNITIFGYDNIVNWITEVIPNNTAVVEVLQRTDKEAIRDEENLVSNESYKKIWEINSYTIYPSSITIYNVTFWTNYSFYGVEDDWEFNVTITHYDITEDITSEIVVDNVNKTIILPPTNMSHITYTIKATKNLPPYVTLVSPENNTQFNNTQTINFTFTATDDTNTTIECSLYIDNNLNQTNNTVQNNTQTTFTTQNINYGTHNWTINCTDGNKTNTSETRTFTIQDTIPPTIQYQTPTEINNSILNRNYIQINVTATDEQTGIKNITINIFNQTGQLIYQNITPNSSQFINYTNAESGIYYFNATATDYYENTNATETRIVRINENPQVNILYPLGEIYDESSIVGIMINATDSDGINYSVAEVVNPNGSINNITLYNSPQRDDFNTNTLNSIWFIENISISENQLCIADIDTTIEDKAFVSLSGNGSPNTDTLCSLVMKYPVIGDFDINVTFNITANEGNDIALNLIVAEKNSSVNPGKQLFIALSNWTGMEQMYEIFAEDDNFSGYIMQRPTEDREGKLRIKREGNNFTFYTWNNTAQEWIEENVTKNFFNINPSLFIILEAESAYPNFGSINISLDNLETGISPNLSVGVFSDTHNNGLYNITIYATDYFGALNNTEKTNFTIKFINDPPTTPFILAPAPNEIVSSYYLITWSQVYDDEEDNLQFNITLLNTDGSINSTIISNYGNRTTTNYLWDTTTYPPGNYSLEIVVFENETPEKNSNSFTMIGNFSIINGPDVFVISPLGETFWDGRNVPIAINSTDLESINCSYANITLPNGSVETLNLEKGQQSDYFENDTLGTNWHIENDTIGEEQTCIIDIDNIVEGKLFISLSGNAYPKTDSYCSLIPFKGLFGDFDISISFNITNFTETDSALNLVLADSPSVTNSKDQIFFVFANWSGYEWEYELFVQEGGSSRYVTWADTNETWRRSEEKEGKLRIKREGNNFTFYTWNNTAQEWIEENLSEEEFQMPKVLYPIISVESTYPKFGSLSVILDNFTINSTEVLFNSFTNTEQLGFYNVTIITNDCIGAKTTNYTNFTISFFNDAPSTPFILTPYPDSYAHLLYTITWSEVYDDEEDNLQFNITLLNTDGSFNSTIISNYGNRTTTNYLWDTTGFEDGEYSMSIVVFENETPEKKSNSYIVEGTFKIDNTPPMLQFLPPTPPNGSIIKGNITINLSVEEENFYYAEIRNETDVLKLCEEKLCTYEINTDEIPEGMYIIYGDSEDLAYNYNQTELRWIIDRTPPSVSANWPPNNAITANSNITFNCSATDNNYLENISLIIDGVINSTLNTGGPSNETEFNLIIPDDTKLVWYCNATDKAGNTYSSVVKNLTINSSAIPSSSNFSGNTTNWAEVPDLTNVCNGTAILETNNALVMWNDCVNAANANFDEFAILNYNNVTINFGLDKSFNSSVTIIMKNLSWDAEPLIYLNENLCNESLGCIIIDYNTTTGTLIFNASHFSSYTTQGNSQLWIWDETDTDMPYANKTKYPNEQTKFYANYTKKSDNTPITNANCTIRFQDQQTTMTYNTTTQLYEHNRTFTTNGTYYWNTTCTAQGYQTLTTNDTTTITPENLPPYVTLISPENNTQLNNTNNITLSFTATDDTNTTIECSLYINNNLNQTNNTVQNNTITHFNLNVTPSSYNWTINCTDGNKTNTSETRTFTIQDTIPPTIQIINPQNNTTYNNATQTLNITANDNYEVDKIWYEWNGTNTTYTTPIQITFNEGQNIINAWANDTTGNTNYTNITFTIDTTPPVIDNLTTETTNETATINWTTNEPANTTITGTFPNSPIINNSYTTNHTYEITQLQPNTTYYYNITHCDNYENCNTTQTYNLTTQPNTYQNQPPTITLISPPNNTQLNNTNNITLSFTATDDTNTTIECSLYINNNLNQTNNTVQNNTITHFNLNVTPSSYNWTINCTDGNKTNTSETRTFTIQDTIPPGIENVTAININILSADIYWDTTENANGTVKYGTDASLGNYAHQLTFTKNHLLTLIGLSNNTTYYYNVTSCDNYNNCNETGIYNFTTLPLVFSVNQISPPNNSVDGDGVVYFSCSAVDSLGLVNISLYINGEINQTSFLGGYYNTTNFTLSNLSDGIYKWYCEAYNLLNDSTTSPNRTLIVNSSAVPYYSNFSGNTTNWAEVPDLTNVCNGTAIIEKPTIGKIIWKECVNAAWQNFDENVKIENNNITVEFGLNPTFNSSATIVMENLPWDATPLIYRDEQLCTQTEGCTIEEYNTTTGRLIFNVTHFTSYTTKGNSQLWIWDETDTDMPYANKTKYPNEQTKFYANYTKKSDNTPITNANCTIRFQDQQTTMTYNTTIQLYEHNRTFTTNGTYYWNTTCTAQGYQTLTTNDTTIITPENESPSVILNYPPNNYFTNNNYINFNWTAINGQDTTLECNITINGIVNASEVLSQNNTPTNYTITGFSEGRYYWNVTCVDDSGNINISQTRVFTIDTTAPIILLNAPTNGSTQTEFKFNWTAIDNFDTSIICNLTIDNAIKGINILSLNNTPTTYRIGSLSAGTHLWNVTCRDDANNKNTSETRVFSIKIIRESRPTGGGRGNSGLPVIIKKWADTLTEEPADYKLSKGEKLEFKLDNNKYELVISEIKEDYATIRISGADYKFDISERKSIDLDKDGKEDIYVTLRNTAVNREIDGVKVTEAYITLQKIAKKEEIFIINATERKIETEPIIAIEEKPEYTGKGSVETANTLFVPLCIFIIIAILFLFILRYIKKKKIKIYFKTDYIYPKKYFTRKEAQKENIRKVYASEFFREFENTRTKEHQTHIKRTHRKSSKLFSKILSRTLNIFVVLLKNISNTLRSGMQKKNVFVYSQNNRAKKIRIIKNKIRAKIKPFLIIFISILLFALLSFIKPVHYIGQAISFISSVDYQIGELIVYISVLIMKLVLVAAVMFFSYHATKYIAVRRKVFFERKTPPAKKISITKNLTIESNKEKTTPSIINLSQSIERGREKSFVSKKYEDLKTKKTEVEKKDSSNKKKIVLLKSKSNNIDERKERIIKELKEVYKWEK